MFIQLRIFCFCIAFSLTCSVTQVFSAPHHEYKKAHEVVAWLYRDFLWTAVMEDAPWSNDFLINQPKEVLSLYFTNDIIDLLLADRACAIRTKEVCHLNFDPIFDSQDPGIYSLQISPLEQSGKVKVQYIHPANQDTIRMTYHVIKKPNGWRIQDIQYSNGESLQKILKGNQ